MKREFRPWTDERGFPLSDEKLKVVCKNWDELTWEAYLKAYENKTGKGHLLKPVDYDFLAENLQESIFEASSRTASPQLQEKVSNAISQLTERQALILTKIFWEGRTQHQIALALGISQPAVFKIKKRSLDNLKEILQGVINSPLVRGQENPKPQEMPLTREQEISWVMNQEIHRYF
ncbi:MAG: sigma-70 family RNA polymerase sigma factor [Bdellovibrionia bacterium]